MPARSLKFDSAAFEDLAWWVQQDRKKALRIIRLVEETTKDPFGGIGKPCASDVEMDRKGRESKDASYN